jgi:hypothetical protein
MITCRKTNPCEIYISTIYLDVLTNNSRLLTWTRVINMSAQDFATPPRHETRAKRTGPSHIPEYYSADSICQPTSTFNQDVPYIIEERSGNNQLRDHIISARDAARQCYSGCLPCPCHAVSRVVQSNRKHFPTVTLI